MNPALSPAPVSRLSLLALLLLAVSCNPVDPEEALLGMSDRCRTDESCAPGFVCENLRCVGAPGQPCREGFEAALCPNEKKLDDSGSAVLMAKQGVCAGARLSCVNGVYEQSCSAQSFGPDFEPDETRCDGLDNDCDGTVDRGPCELSMGVCAGAQRQCTGDLVVRTCGAESYGPQFEPVETRCDGLDNDCDGFADTWSARTLSFFTRAPQPLPVPEGAQYVYEDAQARVVPFGMGYLGIAASTITTTYPYREPPLQTRPAEYRTVIRFQPLDAELNPVAAPSEFYSNERSVQDLQLVPFDGGVFLLWVGVQGTFENEQASYDFASFIARIDVGPSIASPVVGIAPRAPPVAYPGAYFRAVASRDSQQLLLTWNVGQVRGRLVSRDLELQSEELTLSEPHPSDVPGSYLARVDVAAHGDAGYVLAWALTPPTPAGSTEPPGVLLRFRRLSAALEPVGDVVAMTGEGGHLRDLRVLGARQSDEAIFAAWQVGPVSPPPPAPQKPDAMRYAWPFAVGSPVGELIDVSSSRLHVASDSGDQVSVGLTRPGHVPTLRHLTAARERVDRPLPLSPGSGLATFDLLRASDPDRVTVSFSGFDLQPRAVSVCRL